MATLAESPGGDCVGIVYRIGPDAAAVVMAYLDEREKNGYRRQVLDVWLDDGRHREAITYLAEPGSRHYLGPAPLTVMAAQIAAARGPSGTNVEYVLRLAAALRDLGCERDEVFELESILARQGVSGPQAFAAATAPDEDA